MKAPYQTVQLRHRALAAWLTDVPDLDAALAASVDMACGVTDGDGTHHLAMAQRVDLAGVPGDTRSNQRVWWKGHRLHLTIRAHVKRISPARNGEVNNQNPHG